MKSIWIVILESNDLQGVFGVSLLTEEQQWRAGVYCLSVESSDFKSFSVVFAGILS